jgi:hypothetical protein
VAVLNLVGVIKALMGVTRFFLQLLAQAAGAVLTVVIRALSVVLAVQAVAAVVERLQ